MTVKNQPASARFADALALPPKEFALRVGLSRATIFKLISQGRLKSVKVGKSRRIPVSEAQRIVSEGA